MKWLCTRPNSANEVQFFQKHTTDNLLNGIAELNRTSVLEVEPPKSSYTPTRRVYCLVRPCGDWINCWRNSPLPGCSPVGVAGAPLCHHHLRVEKPWNSQQFLFSVSSGIRTLRPFTSLEITWFPSNPRHQNTLQIPLVQSTTTFNQFKKSQRNEFTSSVTSVS